MKPKILLVDDSTFIERVVNDLLGRDFEVDVAHNTAEMHEKFSLKKYDLALMDLELQDGVRVTKILPLIKTYCRKVIVFSQTMAQSDFDACVTAAVDGFVAKNSDPEQLPRAVAMVVAGHQAFPITRLMTYGRCGGSRMPILDDSQHAVLGFLFANPRATNEQIGKAVRLTKGRVANIFTGLYQLLGVGIRAELLDAAKMRGYEPL